MIGGAGGVGSIMIQLARKLTGLTVIATASRPETIKWCTELGAHHTVDHTKPLPEELKRIGIPEVNLRGQPDADREALPVDPGH